jgi:hypothetical protein
MRYKADRSVRRSAVSAVRAVPDTTVSHAPHTLVPCEAAWTAADMRKYPPFSYDEYMCLKPPALLWIAALYLSKSISLPIAIAVGRFAGVSADAVNVLQSLVSADRLLPSIIAAAVVYAMCRRLPTASRTVRWIWAHGRTLLAASAMLDFGLSTYLIAANGATDGPPLPLLIAAGLDGYFLVYVLAARRVRDTFAEFPLLLPSQ